MKRFLTLFFLTISALLLDLNANQLFKEHKTKILSINGNEATVKSFKDVRIGSSGIALHHFDDKHSTIVAKVIVVSKNDKTTTLRFVPFKDLKQSVLPIPKILPKVGDEVILNYLYNYALPIAPNYNAYKQIINNHKDIKWLHPDLFAAILYTNGTPAPTKKDFQKMCSDYNFELLYFAIDHIGYFTDCNSFKVIGEDFVDTGSKKMLPFFTRIKDIEASWYSFNKDSITDYDAYYKKLLR